MTITGPGPGEVWQFADKVRKSTPKGKRWEGVVAAANWVFGQNGKHHHPYIKESAQDRPPDMATIARMVRDVEEARKTSTVESAYYGGIKEFCGWIIGLSKKPELPGILGY